MYGCQSMYNSLAWSIPGYTRNPALISNSISAATPLLVPCWLSSCTILDVPSGELLTVKYTKGLLMIPITFVPCFLYRSVFSVLSRPVCEPASSTSAQHTRGPYHTSKDGTSLICMPERYKQSSVSKNSLILSGALVVGIPASLHKKNHLNQIGQEVV